MKSILFSVVGVLCLIGLSQGAALNEACTPQITCDADLYCDNNFCKVKVGTSCTIKTDCVTLAECTSEKCTCPSATHVPKSDNTTCLKKIDEACTPNTTVCVMGSTCGDVSGSNKCKCAATEIANEAKTMCHVKLNENCSSDASANACVMGASCEGETCMCLANMKQRDNMVDRCYSLNGAICTTVADCFDNNAAHSECNSVNECACKANNMVDDMHKCKLMLGQNCTNTADCGSNTMCNTTCMCKENFINDAGRCGLPVGGDCTSNSHCVSNAECKNDKCACKSGYMTDGNMCKVTSGSSMLAGSFVLVLAAFISTRYH